jgi:hypothetical protein
VLSPFMRCGGRGVEDGCSRGSGRPLKGGDIMVIQTPGRHGQYTPPLHLIAPSGGWDQQARQGVPLHAVP